jgi:tetratricopeptide (TPR) repeat protein
MTMLIKAKTSMRCLSRSVVSSAVAFCFLAAAPGIVSSLPGFESYGVAQAAEKKPKDTRETRRTPALRNAVYEKLSAAQIAAEEKDYKEALSILDDLKNTTGKKELNGYEKANMYNFYAFVYYAQENYPKVIQAYRNVISQPDIPLAMELNTKYQLAQLYFVVEDYNGAIKELKDWFKLTEDAQPSAHVLLAQAYFQTQSYDSALGEVEKAMALAESKGKKPKEQWYLLMRALYYEKGDMKKVAEVLEELLRRWPKREYWTQISGIYGELQQEQKQLIAYETAYVTEGLDRQQELINMSYLFLGSEMPYKATQVLAEGFKREIIEGTSKNYQLMGNALSAAQENKAALPYMEKAAKTAKNGEPWARLANIYFDNDMFKQAIDAGKTALSKKGVRRRDNARIVVGMSLFNLNKLSDARKQFVEAKKDKRSAKVAGQWIQYIDKEAVRRASLAEG